MFPLSEWAGRVAKSGIDTTEHVSALFLLSYFFFWVRLFPYLTAGFLVF